MGITAAITKTAYLVIMACNTEGSCPSSVDAEVWVGNNPKAECQRFVRNKNFDPSDYLELGAGNQFYAVDCEQTLNREVVLKM